MSRFHYYITWKSSQNSNKIGIGWLLRFHSPSSVKLIFHRWINVLG
jgi:hypothetical protein